MRQYFVTARHSPALETRLYGSEGALIGSVVEELGVCQTMTGVEPDDLELNEIVIAYEFIPPGGSSSGPWPSVFYRNQVSNFLTELIGGGGENQGCFDDGA